MLISARCPKCGESVKRDIFRVEKQFHRRDKYRAYCCYIYSNDGSGGLVPREGSRCFGVVFYTPQLLRNYKTFVKVHGEFVGDFA